MVSNIPLMIGFERPAGPDTRPESSDAHAARVHPRPFLTSGTRGDAA